MLGHLEWEDGNPLIGVVVHTHDKYADLLERSLKSILAQTVPKELMEVTVMHDGPVEKQTEEVCFDILGKEVMRSRLLGTHRKYGYYTIPSNYAIVHSEAAYIAFLDADNEYLPDHLSHSLKALRLPSTLDGWPHFTYTRRKYVRDEGADESLPEGDSPFVPWGEEAIARLWSDPRNNFIDTSDIVASRSVFYELAERTGQMWNTQARRFGDYELMGRMARCGFRGRGLNLITTVYHWHGRNLQLTRSPVEGDVAVLPQHEFNKYLDEGKFK